jgi:hypothetical protein
MPKKNPVTVLVPAQFEMKLIFDTKEDARAWWSTWIDGGGEQGMGWHTDIEHSDDWTTGIVPRYLRLVKEKRDGEGTDDG